MDDFSILETIEIAKAYEPDLIWVGIFVGKTNPYCIRWKSRQVEGESFREAISNYVKLR